MAAEEVPRGEADAGDLAAGAHALKEESDHDQHHELHAALVEVLRLNERIRLGFEAFL